MAWTVERNAQSETDLEAIFDFLTSSALEFGETAETAHQRAARRVSQIDAALTKLGIAPHQGTANPEFGSGIRHVTKDRAIIYFRIDEARENVEILAIFFGGQDHRDRMQKRVLDRE